MTTLCGPKAAAHDGRGERRARAVCPTLALNSLSRMPRADLLCPTVLRRLRVRGDGLRRRGLGPPRDPLLDRPGRLQLGTGLLMRPEGHPIYRLMPALTHVLPANGNGRCLA